MVQSGAEQLPINPVAQGIATKVMQEELRLLQAGTPENSLFDQLGAFRTAALAKDRIAPAEANRYVVNVGTVVETIQRLGQNIAQGAMEEDTAGEIVANLAAKLGVTRKMIELQLAIGAERAKRLVQ
jgi:hypothetical protein